MAPAAKGSNGEVVVIGKTGGVHGVKGWLKVFSYTAPKENIFSYKPWLIEKEGLWAEVEFAGSGESGKTRVVKFENVEDREAARQFVNRRIAIYRAQLPEPAPGEYYWADLLQMDVMTMAGNRLGKVVDIRETGANDVLIVEGESRRLIPFVKDEIIKQVDMDNGVIKVEWQWD